MKKPKKKVRGTSAKSKTMAKKKAKSKTARAAPKRKSRVTSNIPKRVRKKKEVLRAQRSPSKPVTRRKLRAYGSSVRKVVHSIKFKEKVTIVRKQTSFSKGVKLKKGSKNRDDILKKFYPIAEKHFKKIGISKKNLRLVKFRYTFKVNGKKRTQYFSAKISKFKNKKQLKEMMAMTIESFQARLSQYEAQGFEDISIDGISAQGYKDE